MKEFKPTPRDRDDSLDYDEREDRELDVDDGRDVAPGKRTRTTSLNEALADLGDTAVPHTFARQAAVARALQDGGSGASLDPAVAMEFGERLGTPLGNVRVHADAGSAQVVAALGARAFAFGRHLFFGPGAYEPNTDAGRELIAHELAHVAQQPRGDADAGAEISLGRGGDAFEQQADLAAAHMVAGLPAAVTPAPVAARFDTGGGSVNAGAVLRKHIGTDESRAKNALKSAGAKRGMIEQIIRGNFPKETAEKIIKGTKGGGGETAPEVDGKGAKATAKGKGDGGEGKGGEGKGKGKGKAGAKGGGGGGGDVQAKGGGGGGGGGGDCGDLGINALTGEQRQFITAELAEHQAWSTAGNIVGAPGSAERLAFIGDQIMRGAGQGATTALVMGVGMGIVGQLAQRFCPIPGVGAIIAGGMAVYGMFTRDWGQTGETLSNFGEGSSEWEVWANSLAAISEIIDLLCNVLNIIAGVIGLISAIMWIITIITVGIASPLAGTLSAIALGILTVSGVLDNINNMVLQPAVLAFRAMHVLNSDADPREIVGQGGKLADSASKVAGAIVGFGVGRGIDAAGKGIDARSSRRSGGSSGGAPDAAPPARSGGAPDAAPPTRSGDAPDGPRPATAADRVEAHARAKAANADRNWREKMTFYREKGLPAMRKAFKDHRRDYADRVQARQDRTNEERRRAHEEANRRHAEDRMGPEEAARARAEEPQRAYDEARADHKQRFGDALKRAGQRAVEARREAARVRNESRRELRTRQAELNANHRSALADAAKIPDPAARAKAEARANRRHKRGTRKLEIERQMADDARDMARSDAQKRFEAENRQAYDDARARRTAREQEYAEAKRRAEEARPADEQAAADRRARQQAQRDEANREHGERISKLADRRTQLDAKHQAELAAAAKITDPAARATAEQRAQRRHERANRRLDLEKQMANDAKELALKDADPAYAEQRAQRDNRRAAGEAKARALDEANRQHAERSGEDRPEGFFDVYKPSTLRDEVGNLRKSWRERRDRVAGQRSLDEGDATAGQLDPGRVPGGGPVKDWVDEQSKQAWGLSKPSGGDPSQEEEPEGDGANARPSGTAPAASGGGAKGPQQKEDAPAGGSKGARKNPQYQDAPGNLKKLDAIKAKLEAAVDRECQADDAARAMSKQEAAHKAHEAPLEALGGASKKAIAKVGEHKGDVATKKDANVKQGEHQGKAAQKVKDYASQSSRFDAVITPMRGVERFTYIGERVGVSHFGKMNRQIKKTLKSFDSMNAAMKKQAAGGAQQKAELAAKGEKITATDQKAAKTEASLQKSDSDVADMKTKNAATIGEAGAARGEAEGQKATYAEKAAGFRAEYNALAGSLVSWAAGHKSAREAAQSGAKPTDQDSAPPAQAAKGDAGGADADDDEEEGD